MRIASEDLSKLKMPIGERLKKAFVSSFNWKKFASYVISTIFVGAEF